MYLWCVFSFVGEVAFAERRVCARACVYPCVPLCVGGVVGILHSRAVRVCWSAGGNHSPGKAGCCLGQAVVTGRAGLTWASPGPPGSFPAIVPWVWGVGILGTGASPFGKAPPAASTLGKKWPPHAGVTAGDPQVPGDMPCTLCLFGDAA